MQTGREYLRVSHDPSGRMRSPSEQHAENLEAAKRRGVTLAEPYREPRAVGASRRSRGVRRGFEQLVDDIRAGNFGADELWLWESSRGSRKVAEWVALIEACEHAGVGIYVTTHSRLYDPSNARDRRSMLEDAVESEYEVEKIRERTARGVRSRAAAGRPHGKHLYGYKREYDPQTRELVAVVVDDQAAPIVREVFTRFADGDTFTAIARDLTRRGVPRPRAAPVWRAVTLLSIVRNPGYIGQRVSKAGHGTVEGAWPAIVDDTLWWRAQARLDDPHRPPRTDPTVKHLLSGLAVCGVCGGKLIWSSGSGRARAALPNYRCDDRGCVGRIAGHWSPTEARGLEGQVVESVLTLWDDDPRLAAGDDPRLGELAEELRALRARLKSWQDSAGDDGVSPASVAAAERKLQPQIDTAERQLRALRARAMLPDLGGRWLRDAWETLTLAQQRAIIAASVTVTVAPVGRGRQYDPDSVRIEPR